MKVARAALALLAALLLLSVPGLVSAQGAAAVSGTLTYRDRSTLPANAVVTVQIAEVATAGRPGTVVAEQRFTTNGAQPPFRYSIAYDPARVDAARQYTVQANITVNNAPRYSTNTVYRVITGGAPVSDVNLVLVATTRLPPTSAGTLPLLIGGLALLAAVAVFAVRRTVAARARARASA
jgi:putative lipoprotein